MANLPFYLGLVVTLITSYLHGAGIISDIPLLIGLFAASLIVAANPSGEKPTKNSPTA